MQGILGQPHAVGLLQSALSSGRVHHAYIFHGAVGVGKCTTAYRFAAVLLCHNRQTGSDGGRVMACGDCPSCRLLGDDVGHDAAHPDLHVVIKELARFSPDPSVRGRKLTSIPVDVLRRSLIEPVYRRAQMGRVKVFIVDEAHLLNPTGQNLLLKTLEQPPEGTYIILVTDSQDQLLVTVRSRCQRVPFVPLSDSVVSHWLDEQPFDLTAAQRSWLVGFAAGSLGRAKLAVEYDLVEWAQVVLPALDRMNQGGLPVDLGQQLAQRIDAFAKQWVDRHDGASKEAANRLSSQLMWSVIGQHARHQLIELSAGAQGHDPEAVQTRLNPWLGVIDVLETAQRALAANVNMGLVCDHLVSLVYRSLSGRSCQHIG